MTTAITIIGLALGVSFGWLHIRTDRENRALRLEVADLKAAALFANIKHFEYEPGQINLTMQTGVGRILCDFARDILTAHNAPNFTSMTFRFCDKEEFYILIGRCSGRTLVEKYHQARQEIDELKNKIQATARQPGRNARSGGGEDELVI